NSCRHWTKPTPGRCSSPTVSPAAPRPRTWPGCAGCTWRSCSPAAEPVRTLRGPGAPAVLIGPGPVGHRVQQRRTAAGIIDGDDEPSPAGALHGDRVAGAHHHSDGAVLIRCDPQPPASELPTRADLGDVGA